MKSPSPTDLSQAIDRLRQHCASQNYEGFSKFDALNSPWIEKLSGQSMVLRLLASQAVNRVPLPLRHWTGVKKRRNAKGIGNFVRGLGTLYLANPEKALKEEVKSLSQWLLENESHRLGAYDGPGMAWGYPFPWQSPGFFAPRFAPNCIVTVFVGEGLLIAYQVTGESAYLEAARGVRQFILEYLPRLEETASQLCLGYVKEGLKWKVININAVSAGFLSKLAKAESNSEGYQIPKRLINWVMSVQSEGGYWNYTHPKKQSGIGPDNYHTGGILDGIFDYMEASGDRSFEPAWRKALVFYRQHFFTETGSPNWRVGKRYPQDIHGAAQGILTFVRAARWYPPYLDVAGLIAQWALSEMQSPEGGFYYQKWRAFTWKIPLMRWNNSWMMMALSQYQAAIEKSQFPPKAVTS